MAAVSVPPSPQALSTMASRRVPLASVPNATNSPYRPTAATATKRPRSHASEQRDVTYVGQPPAKKQFFEENDTEARRQAILKKTSSTQSAVQKKLEAAREVKPNQKPVERSQKTTQDNYDTIRQWQKHYRKVFPQYVFYFENIPADARARATKQILALGAREEKFFSKSVTHVVTTRQIPPEQPTSSSVDSRPTSSNHITSQDDAGHLRTINPSLLDRSGESQGAARTRLALELAAARKPSTSNAHGIFQDVETRARNGDILMKAREMGMKIWALEKLERILTTMFNTETGEQPPAYHKRGSTTVTATKTRGADLSQLLKNEKVNGPADRDLGVSTKDMAHFRGYYVYVHCMNEKYRPVIMRDYPKTSKEEGKWPQFRLTGPGRCPFVEDPQHLRKLQLQDYQKTQQRGERATSAAPRTRSASAAVEGKQRTASQAETRRPLTENNNVARRTSATEESTDTVLSKPLDPPKLIPAKRKENDGVPPLFGSAQASLRAMPRYAGGEPVASGVQPSNITSAIKSQVISSTAAAPGARAGTSKELHQLSRKVLEKNSAPNNSNSAYLTDMRAALNGDGAPPPRASKNKAQETIAGALDDSGETGKQRSGRVIVARKKSIEKDPKPGYCENCREKFDDFDIHILGRKHRKFATSPSNWTELDDLLSQLTRPYL